MQHLAAFVLALAACGSPAKPVANKAPAPIVPPAAEAVTLQELQNGDRACYVVVMKGTEQQSIEGDFELCKGGAHDATALIGKKITYATKKANVLAASCEGNMDCGKSDEVDLVVTITAVP